MSSFSLGKSGKVPPDRLKQHLPPWLHEVFDKYVKNEEFDWSEKSSEFLQDIRDLFPRGDDCNLEANKILDDLSETEEFDEDAITSIDDECKDMTEFVDRVKVFLKTRMSTLMGPTSRCYPKTLNNEYYSEFNSYLKQQRFKHKMVDVIYKMFLLHPDLPENPMKYIRDNYGFTKEEELQDVKKWLYLKSTIDKLKERNLELKSRVSAILSTRTSIGRRTSVRPEIPSNSAEPRRRTRGTVASKSGTAKRKTVSTGDLTSTSSTKLQTAKSVESWTKLYPVVHHPIDWNYESGQYYMGQDSKVPFDPPEYDLNVMWDAKPVLGDLVTIDDADLPRTIGNENDTSSSSDYSVESLPPIVD